MRPELPSTIIKKGARVGASIGIGLASVLSPIEQEPRPVQADQQLTLLHGDGGKNRHTTLLVSQGASVEMMQITKDDLLSIEPMREVMGKMNIYMLQNVEDLRCDQNARCDWQALNRVIDRVVATGIIPHETTVIVRSNDEGGDGKSLLPSYSSKPDIYTTSVVVRSGNTTGSVRELHAGTVLHEWFHQTMGWGHEGGDIMERVCNCLNPQHTQFLRAFMDLAPYNYITPKNEVKVTGGSLSLKADLITPTGTTQKKRWIIPANNDGPDITLLRNPESLFEVPAPQIGVGNYILLPDMTYTWKEWSSNKPTALPWASPEWDRFEGWPGIFFPNTPAEVRIKTPKRFSSGIGLITLAGGQETNDLTPILTWNNRDQDVFYYEVQLSKDSTFNNDPATATAAVYWELRHGGMTNPLNSYTVPNNYPLEKSSTYYWRVRPRIQGDGTPVAWSNMGSFKTSADARVQTKIVLHQKDYGEIDWDKMHADHWQAVSDIIHHTPSESLKSELTIIREIKTDNSLTRILIPGTKQAVLPKEEQNLLAA